jgi:ABC-type spermidine/putrescine transport system permease subunit I
MPSGTACGRTSKPVREGAVRARRRRSAVEGVWYPRWFWPSFSIPATIWLLLLFLLPFYAIVSVAFGRLDPILGTAQPVWNPLDWNTTAFTFVLNQTFLIGGIFRPAFLRTLEYVTVATILSLLIGYPVAYFIARYGGRYRSLLLVTLIAPFWISYLMRMLAWVNLLQGDGLVNRTLLDLHLIGGPVNWLDGKSYTVILGLVYGYIPYMILPLFASLDRIDRSLLEAARDLGANRFAAFRRVTLPLSKQAILAGVVIVTLPMFGDYYTNNLLSASPRTSMIGNLIDNTISSPLVGQAASMVVVLMLLLLLPMLYYLYATNRATRTGTA